MGEKDQLRRSSIWPLGILDRFQENGGENYQRNNRRKFPRTERCWFSDWGFTKGPKYNIMSLCFRHQKWEAPKCFQKGSSRGFTINGLEDSLLGKKLSYRLLIHLLMWQIILIDGLPFCWIIKKKLWENHRKESKPKKSKSIKLPKKGNRTIIESCLRSGHVLLLVVEEENIDLIFKM